MNKLFAILLSLSFLLSGTMMAQEKGKKEKEKKETKEKKPVVHKELKTELDSVSYVLGMAIGKTINSGGLGEMNQALFNKALAQTIAEEDPWIPEDQVEKIITAYLQKVEAQKSEKNIAANKKFLEENKKKEGVVELPSGLQYKVITEGKGAKPGPTDLVTVHYHGTLINGKVFDSSIDRGEPIQLEVGKVIAGWTEALQLMSVGSKWTLYIPPTLGYGDRAMPGSPIEANSLLIFEVELINIEQPEPAEATPLPMYQDLLNK